LAYSILETNIGAEAVLTPSTEIALATNDDWFDHDPITFLHLRHVTSNFQNFPGDFMPNRHREGGCRVLAFEDVQITSADRGGLDLHEDAVTVETRQFSLSMLDLPGGGDEGHWIGTFHFSVLSP
jgi:hypothetical protein